ncbi:hypothetical protein EB796_023493 [Bugula neritina]|uniref:Uncharacterized protein n=1 Tax=Bugula neritina TaxID=10212 RepID=A0A7J7IWI6_BUGNE|nr:hypothetical protein EB796_023493 [Bugula neritina]
MDPGSSNTLNSLISSIDNLSVRSKQLPQRPQIEKPLLKYSNSEPGPIYLYQNPDLKPGLVNSAPNSPSKVLQNKKTISSTNAPSARKVTASPVHFGYVPPDDPYARPLSAKDLMTLGLERTKTLNHIMSSTLAGSLANSMHATNMSNISLFKTAKTPDGSPKQPSDTSSANSSSLPVNVNNHNTVTTTKVVSIHSAEANTVMTQSAKEKFEATLAKPASGSDRGTRPPSSLRRPRSSSVRNPNYSPAKPYEEVLTNEEEDFKMVSDQQTKQDGEEGLNHRISKAISTLSRASSLVNRNCLAQHSSSESLDRPNSTHTVNSGSNQLICTKLTPTIPAALASTKTVNTAAAVRPISAVSCSSAGKGSNHRISKAISTLSRASSLVNRNCLSQHSSSESLDRPNSTHTVTSGSNQLICTKLTPTIPAALASTKTVNTAAAVRPISAVSCSSAGKGSGSSSASSRHHKRGDSATTYYL